MSEHNPFRAFGVVDPAMATAGTGLDFLKSMLERREPSPPFSETTDIWMVWAETGCVVFEGMPSTRFYNPMGMIHGGWIATLLDSCMGCAVQSTLKAAQTLRDERLWPRISLCRSNPCCHYPCSCDAEKLVRFGSMTVFAAGSRRCEAFPHCVRQRTDTDYAGREPWTIDDEAGFWAAACVANFNTTDPAGGD